MTEKIKNFDEFINEDINFEHTDEGCFLTRGWYYYDNEDEIVYGSDEKPEPQKKSPIVFCINPMTIYLDGVRYTEENDITQDMVLFTFDLDTYVPSVYTSLSDITKYLSDIGIDIKRRKYALSEMSDEIQDVFDNNDDVKHMLIVGEQLVASTFDVIEEN